MNKNHTIDKFPFLSSESIQGWSASVLLHAALLLILVFWMPMTAIVLEQEPFRWEVSLVNSASKDTLQIVQTAAEVTSSELSSNTSSPETSSYPLQKNRMIPPAVRQSRSQPSPSPRSTPEIEEKLINPELQKAIQPEPTHPEPAVTEIAKEEPSKESVPETTPITESMAQTDIPKTPAPVFHESPANPATSSIPTDLPALETASTPTSSAQTSAAKANHRWVGESLWRRVTELKRYPSLARLNRTEGEVIVRAVIEANGNLMNVKIRKSSGNDHLDEAALDVVRQACPLHMEHQLEVAQVVVDLPISYSLRR